LEGWVSNSAAQWTEQTGLTRREQETARRELARAGVWEEALAGMPPRLVARIRLDGLLARLAGDEPESAARIPKPCFPDCSIPANRLSPNGESRMRQPHMLVSPKAPNQFHRNHHHSSAKSAILHIQGSTSVSVQPLHAGNERRSESRSHSGGDLIFPDMLLPEERASARLLLRRCEDQAQALLDELSARMQAGGVHSSPIAYLRGLVRRATAGEFVPELGLRVAAARRRRLDELIQRQQHEADEQRLAAERTTPEYQTKVAARREEIRRMLDVMKPGREPRRHS
jgi:hypothetical protein